MTLRQRLASRPFHSLIFTLLIFALALVSKPKFGASTWPYFCLVWVGYVLVVAGVLGRVYSAFYIAGSKGVMCVQQGPYSIVRNPLYLCSLIGAFGLGLSSGMVTLAALFVVGFVLYYPSVVAKEEAFLERRFGDQYRSYKRDVARWTPRMRLWTEPQLVFAKPPQIRGTIRDASLFFLSVPAFALIEQLHRSGIIRSLMTLP